MRSRFTGVWLAAFLALAATACGSSASSGAGHKSSASSSASGNGALASAGKTTAPSSPAASAPATATVPAGVRTFAFPASFQVEFRASLPASGPKRSAIIGYENYVYSMWYGIYTRGADTTYETYSGGNALSFTQSMIKDSQTGEKSVTPSGKIIYYDVSVPLVYSTAATVQACVDASALNVVNVKTGQNEGNMFGSKYDHYQDQASVGKGFFGGPWAVSHTDSYAPSYGGSAKACA